MKKILIINNDDDAMSLLKRWLEKKSYEVKYTSSRDSVIDIIKEFKPDLALIDVLQKKAAEDIKSHEQNIPVILMTGYTLQGRSTTITFNDMIEKPFNLKVLQNKIEKLLPDEPKVKLPTL